MSDITLYHLAGRSDSEDSMDWEISVQTHVASFEATAEEDRLNVFGAAKVSNSS